MTAFSARASVGVPAGDRDTCPLSVSSKHGSEDKETLPPTHTHTHCWLEVQMAICRDSYLLILILICNLEAGGLARILKHG